MSSTTLSPAPSLLLLPVNLAVARIAHRNQVLRHVEGAPGRVSQVVDLGCPSLVASLAAPTGPLHDSAAYRAESRVGQVLGIGAIGAFVRKGSGDWSDRRR